MHDWECTKANQKIQGAVEWHEETQIEVPEWCPIAINNMYSEEEILEALEPFKMNLPFHYEMLIKELLQIQRNKKYEFLSEVDSKINVILDAWYY